MEEMEVTKGSVDQEEDPEDSHSLEENEEDQEVTKEVTTKVYCLACGESDLEGMAEVNKIKREEDSEGNLEGIGGDLPEVSRENGKKLLSSFCTLMDIKLEEMDLEETLEGMGGSRGYFCLACRNQLELLLDLKRKLEELEKDLERGIEEFRSMCEVAEVKFQVGQVYKEGVLYRKIRSQICGGEVTKIGSRRKPPKKGVKEVPRNEETILVKEEPDSLSIEPPAPEDIEPPEDDNEVESDSSHSSETASVTSHSSSDYLPPPSTKRQAKTLVKSRLPPKKRKRPGRPPNKNPGTSPKKKKAVQKRKLKQASSQNDQEDDDDDDEEDLESSLKGRMSTDPLTGHTIFLDILFESLPNSRYRCLTCPNPTSYHRGSLKKHVLTIHKSLFSCPECGQRCHSTASLESHIRRVHRGEDRKFLPCPICSKPCSAKKGRLEKHQATHLSLQEKSDLLARGEPIPQWNKLRRHICDICGRGYELRSHLTQHKIREHPSTDYTEDQQLACKIMCPDCGKLVHKHYLKKHQEFVHSGPDQVKRFACALCEKRFVKEGDLRKHKRVVHEKMKPWKCSECPKTFAMKHQLTYHQNNHRNIRPWQCDFCPMGFARKHHLQRHLRIYHEPGANPRRKTYVRGPETKVSREETLEVTTVPPDASWMNNEAL